MTESEPKMADTDSDQTEYFDVDMYMYAEEEYLGGSEREDVELYDLYDHQHSSRNTPLVHSSQLRDSDAENIPDGGEDRATKDPPVEGTDTDQHTVTVGHSAERKGDDASKDLNEGGRS